MNVKMIVIDLDDTLLRTNKTISERSLATLKLCREHGIKVLYATGRGDSAKDLAPSELFDGTVYMNGATAYIGDTLIYSRLIPIKNVRDLLNAADNAGIKIAAQYGGMDYANFNVTAQWPWILNYEISEFNTLDIDAEKLYAVIEKPQDTELIKKYLQNGLYLRVGRDGLAMVMHEEAVKSNAVAAIAAHCGIEQSDIVAFGDDTNDIDLLEYCGIGVAMGNALDEVKAAADYVCDTNDNDGVAKWLEENVL